MSSVAQQSNRHNSGQQSSGGYSNNSSRSNQEKSKWNSNYSQNSRQNENVYRSSGRGAGYSGGYNNRNMDRMVHAETEEYDDGRYYYDQYGGGYIQSHPRGQGYFNYPQSRDARSQYADSRGTQQYSDYEYDPRWNQQDMPRSRSSSHRDQYVDPNLYSDRSYGTDSNLYQPDRGSTRDMRYNQNPPPPQTWTAYQESENPTQRNTSNYYPRSDQRSGGVRQNDEFVPSHEYEEYRRPTEYEPFPGPSHERKQSSGWLDIEGLIGAGAESADHYNGLDPGLDLNFQL